MRAAYGVDVVSLHRLDVALHHGSRYRFAEFIAVLVIIDTMHKNRLAIDAQFAIGDIDDAETDADCGADARTGGVEGDNQGVEVGRFGVPAGWLIDCRHERRIGGVATGMSHREACGRAGDAAGEGRGEYCTPVGSKQLQVDGATGLLPEGAYGGVDA